jgi:HEAT repeat protein
VERALERLRLVFAKRGIAATSTLAAAISANAVQLAPAGLSLTLTTAAIATTGAGTFTLMKMMSMTNLKLGFSALVVAGAATALVVQHQAQNMLRNENGLLQQQVAQLRTDNESFSNRLAAAGDNKKLPDQQFNELLRLRGEVTRLRNNASALAPSRNAPAFQETNQADSVFVIQGRTVADWVSEFQIGGFLGETNLANGVLDSAGPPILPQLARLLRDKSFDQKAKAAAAINEICYLNPDTPEADAVIPTLTASTKNDDSEVRIYSVQALGAIGKAASSATLDLIQLTRDPNASVRMCAVETLGRINADSPESLAAVKAALADTSEDVRITAKKALELIQSNHQ